MKSGKNIGSTDEKGKTEMQTNKGDLMYSVRKPFVMYASA